MLRLLIKLYESVENPDWVSISQCLLLLDDAPEVAKVLERLLKGSEVSLLAMTLPVRHRYVLQTSLCERFYARLTNHLEAVERGWSCRRTCCWHTSCASISLRMSLRPSTSR